MLSAIIGKRYSNLDEIKKDIENITNKKIASIIESESEQIPDIDFMIDFYFISDDFNVYTIFYLKDNANNYYITEI